MKTDDPATRQRGEVDGDEAKVVRLSDWLAPEDELVPFGPRAHAQTSTPEPAEGRTDPDLGVEPPAASGFWDGDPSVHTAVPGPGIFDEPERTAERGGYRRAAPVWRPALPSFDPFAWGSRVRERLADVDRLSWRWAAAAVTSVALALIVLVITLGGSSTGHHDTAAQASIGESTPPVLSGTLGDIGTALRAAAVSNLRRLPPVDTAGRTIGTAAVHAGTLRIRHRNHVVVASASIPSSAATGSVETPTSTTASTETTSAPSETGPAQTTSGTSPTTSGGGGSTGGGSSGDGSSSGSQTQSTFGATGALGPGSSPNG